MKRLLEQLEFNFVKDYSRKFVHVNGFKDGTKYIEVLPNGDGFAICEDGTKRSSWAGLDRCLDLVKQGIYEEL